MPSIYYQLIVTKDYNPNRNSVYRSTDTDIRRYNPMTTIAGCKRMYTKAITRARDLNKSAKLRGEPPYVLSMSAEIVECRWEPSQTLPTHNLLEEYNE